jgi:hypothetical protein
MLRMSLTAITSVLAVVLAGSTPSLAQTHQPYAGLQARSIKALSDRQVADLRAGRGMELALAAELNGYPGPAHVIELAAQLSLTPIQFDRVKRLQDEMKAGAVELGERLIAQEAALDRQFAERSITQARLPDATGEIARTLGELRAAHLKYHLTTIEVLSPDQVRRYSQLRGYSNASEKPSHPHGRHNEN